MTITIDQHRTNKQLLGDALNILYFIEDRLMYRNKKIGHIVDSIQKIKLRS